MTILFLGNFRSPYSSESYYKRTFEKLGHSVIALQETEANKHDIVRYENVDLFFWVKTHGWETEGMLDVLKIFKEKNIPTVAWHLDLYMGLERWNKYVNGDYFQVEHFFTVDKLFAEWLNANTKTKGYYLPAGVFEDECYIAEPNREKYPHDIIFVGSRNYHKEWPYRKQLIEWLELIYWKRFAQYGGGGLPTVRGHELNVLYASAKIVIGDTLCKDFNYPAYFSDRLFETTGRGGFLIFPYITGLEDYYEVRKEIVIYPFDHFNYLKNLIDAYLIDDSEREEIRIAGHNRAKRDHTYTQRLQSLLKTVFQ